MKVALDQAPSGKTVRDWIGKKWIALSDLDAPWALFDGKPEEDLPSILSVGRWLLDGGWPPIRWPTRAVAAWISRIGRAFPELSKNPGMLYRVSVSANQPTHADDAQVFLAYAPWRDDGDALYRAIAAGSVPRRVALVGGGDFHTGSLHWEAEREGPDWKGMAEARRMMREGSGK